LRSSPIDHAHFLHDDHTGFVCTTCHHNFTDRTGTENCITCHKALSTSEAMRVDRLFHAFCTDCHRRESLAGHKSGPLDHCTACHDG
jgi:predicted CXXCH cytochrome family protein